ncbi:L-type lectin-domain containing receptor kinase IX.1 [Morella rubra]|uniref:non-specific serine/threonine protein kinase n=1 Tax=Morella rubra TaxID=262757 RepID=A0A6A1V2H5_9ROSI|nr:L-type lectin-domain containing receptor kinase IX.1 [Morella rubra]KAB1206915.1 L-type lectin-domain containing receptor kinase IX.1 [Morella rubra]
MVVSPPKPLLPFLIITILFFLILPCATQLSFNFSDFSKTTNELITLNGNATFSRSVIRLTPDESDNWGRAKYSRLMRLWDKESGELADFTTSFSFIVSSEGKDRYSDGLTFFLASPGFPSPTPTDGAGIGLISRNQATDPSFLAANKFVAVEFDTFPNDGLDPPVPVREHVGININGIISQKTVQWYSVIKETRTYNASISYDSTTKNLSVTFTGFSSDTNYTIPILQHLSDVVNLTENLPELVELGFSASTGYLSELHILCSWSFESRKPSVNQNSPPPKKNEYESKVKMAVGISVGGCILITGLGLVWYMSKRKRPRGGEEEDAAFSLSMDDEFERSTRPKKFSYEELVGATNNFAEENKLGQGGFGGVYKGFLKDVNSDVAVKRVSTGSKQGIKEYASEVKTIAHLRHRNLVQLIGWCHEKKDLLLVYEFMPNGSLDLHLFKGKSLLAWVTRYNISRGLASALLYLQEEWEQCVLHRDIKSSNIMLDSSFNAKLGDFGLARLVDHEKLGSQTSALAGTMGYMALEYVMSSRATKESDIYSFGVVLLEIACGRKPHEPQAREGEFSIIEWVWELYGTGKLLDAADPKLCGHFDEQQMERLMVVGLWCVHPDYTLRPSIRKVVRVLDFEASLPILQPKMPLLAYLDAPVGDSASSGHTTSENQHSDQSASHGSHTGSSQVAYSIASSSSTAHFQPVDTR